MKCYATCLILPILADRETDTSQDTLSKDPSTSLNYKGVNDNEIPPALDDLTDIHIKKERLPPENSRTETLPPKYLRRARRDLQPLSGWIRVRRIHGVPK